MRCFTLRIGEDLPRRGIQLACHGRQGLPELRIGKLTGAAIPLHPDFAARVRELDALAQELPECKGVDHLQVFNADLEWDPNRSDPNRSNPYALLSRPCSEESRKVLLHLLPPVGEGIHYMGANRLESFQEERRRVVAHYPPIETVVGIEVILAHYGELLVVMHPGATFRAMRARGLHPRSHTYSLTTARRPFVVKIQRKSDQRHRDVA